MTTRFQPLKFQTPIFETDQPVFPDAPLRFTPYILHNIRNRKWVMEIQVLTLQYLIHGHIIYKINGAIGALNRIDVGLPYKQQALRIFLWRMRTFRRSGDYNECLQRM